MRKYRFFILLFFTVSLNIQAAENKNLLEEVDQLMASGKILDAYKTLENADPQNKDLNIFLVKLNLALNFHVVQLQLQHSSSKCNFC